MCAFPNVIVGFVSLVSGSFSISNVSLTTDFKFMKGFNKFKGNLGGIEVTFSSQSVRRKAKKSKISFG